MKDLLQIYENLKKLYKQNPSLISCGYLSVDMVIESCDEEYQNILKERDEILRNFSYKKARYFVKKKNDLKRQVLGEFNYYHDILCNKSQQH